METRADLYSVETLRATVRRLRHLIERDGYADAGFSDDYETNPLAGYQALQAYWYDGFVKLYVDKGRSFDNMAEELQSERDRAYKAWSGAQNYAGGLAMAIGMLSRLIKDGTFSSRSRESIDEEEYKSAMIDDVKTEIIEIIGDPALNLIHAKGVDLLNQLLDEAKSRLQWSRDELQKTSIDYNIVTLRQQALQDAHRNCGRCGDFRTWREIAAEKNGSLHPQDELGDDTKLSETRGYHENALIAWALLAKNPKWDQLQEVQKGAAEYVGVNDPLRRVRDKLREDFGLQTKTVTQLRIALDVWVAWYCAQPAGGEKRAKEFLEYKNIAWPGLPQETSETSEISRV